MNMISNFDFQFNSTINSTVPVLGNFSWNQITGKYITKGMPWYRKWTILYAQPIIIPLSILGNILTLIVLPMRTVRMNNRCRYLYVFYTLAETSLIFFKDIQDGFLADGLYLLSNGRIDIFLEILSSFGCKFFRGTRFSTEALAAYTLVIMNLER